MLHFSSIFWTKGCHSNDQLLPSYYEEITLKKKKLEMVKVSQNIKIPLNIFLRILWITKGHYLCEIIKVKKKHWFRVPCFRKRRRLLPRLLQIIQKATVQPITEFSSWLCLLSKLFLKVMLFNVFVNILSTFLYLN